MQPSQPGSQPSSPYDFILGDGSKKAGPKPGQSPPKIKRILIVAGGALVLIIAIVVFFSIISSKGKGSTQVLIDLAEDQTEIIRVADIGTAKARVTSVKNLAATTSLSMQTAQVSTLNLLKKSGHKISTKVLSLKKDINTDATLTAADEGNRFDETFTKLIITSLTNYRAAVKKAYDATSSKSEKQLLSDNYQATGLIIGSQTASAQ